jgi:hypothetical protein
MGVASLMRTAYPPSILANSRLRTIAQARCAPDASPAAKRPSTYYIGVLRRVLTSLLQRFARSGDMTGPVLAAWPDETNRLPSQRPGPG